MDYRKKRERHWNTVPRDKIGVTHIGDIVRGTLTQPQPEHGDSWGIWTYDAKRLVLVAGEACLSRGGGYEIPLSQMTTSAGMLNWIFQVAKKTWVTPTVIGDLVAALEDLLKPQRNLCGSGIDKRFNVQRHLEIENAPVKYSMAEEDGNTNAPSES